MPRLEIRAPLGGVQEPGVLRKLVGGGKAVQGPRLPARPAGIVAPALVGGLPQELAGLQVKDTLVGRAAVAPNQVTAGG